jgi:hypothetical protein
MPPVLRWDSAQSYVPKDDPQDTKTPGLITPVLVKSRTSPARSFEFWLRGRATSGTCSCGTGLRESLAGTGQASRASPPG